MLGYSAWILKIYPLPKTTAVVIGSIRGKDSCERLPSCAPPIEEPPVVGSHAPFPRDRCGYLMACQNGEFPWMGVPQNGLFYTETPIKLDDFGVPLFMETPKCSPLFRQLSWSCSKTFDSSWPIWVLATAAIPIHKPPKQSWNCQKSMEWTSYVEQAGSLIIQQFNRPDIWYQICI